MALDFSGANSQGGRDLIPAGTLLAVVMTLTRGGTGPDGWLLPSNDKASASLECQLKVLDGPYKGRIIFDRLTLMGNVKHEGFIADSNSKLRAILEATRGVAPDRTKKSPEWKAAMETKDYGDFHGTTFLMKAAIKKGSGGYADKNIIGEIVVPGAREYQRIQPVEVGPPREPREMAQPQPASNYANGGNAQSGAQEAAGAPLPSPAVTIQKPNWASN
jgi:hypothetical protein